MVVGQVAAAQYLVHPTGEEPAGWHLKQRKQRCNTSGGGMGDCMGAGGRNGAHTVLVEHSSCVW
jgi:hypothetical protein